MAPTVHIDLRASGTHFSRSASTNIRIQYYRFPHNISTQCYRFLFYSALSINLLSLFPSLRELSSQNIKGKRGNLTRARLRKSQLVDWSQESKEINKFPWIPWNRVQEPNITILFNKEEKHKVTQARSKLIYWTMNIGWPMLYHLWFHSS